MTNNVVRVRFGAKRADELYRHACASDDGYPNHAAKTYKAALKLDPEHCGCLVNLGNLHYRKGQYKQAVKLYRAALKLEPGHPEASYNLGYLRQAEASAARNAAAASRKAMEAIALFRAALQRKPDFADAHFNLASSLQAVGRRSEACEHLREYLRLDGASEWADVARARLRALGD